PAATRDSHDDFAARPVPRLHFSPARDRMKLGKLRHTVWLLAAAAGAVPLQAGAQEGTGSSGRIVDARVAARIDSTLAAFVSGGRVAGVSALIHGEGQAVDFGPRDLFDREGGVPMVRSTIVQIFSVTQPVTGVALMTLYDQRAFDPDVPVARYAPEFADVRLY